jgi:hypothetical protein
MNPDLQSMIARWRSSANCGRWSCADELEAALAAGGTLRESPDIRSLAEDVELSLLDTREGDAARIDSLVAFGKRVLAVERGTAAEKDDDDLATAELLATLDALYPLPDDDRRVERAGRTAAAVKRWMSRAIESLVPDVLSRLHTHLPPAEAVAGPQERRMGVGEKLLRETFGPPQSEIAAKETP